MNWRTIKRIRGCIENQGYFVIKVMDDCFQCTHLDDETETFYYIYPNECGYTVYTSKLQQL
jgi:hypothetical protein